MSNLLNDSTTAVKVRDRILAELKSGEQVYYVAEGQILEPTGSGPGAFNLYVGALIVTNQRLLVAESKMGRARFQSLQWVDLEKMGRRADGCVLYQKTLKQGVHWPLWEAKIWVGKSFKTPLDMKALDVLELSSREAFTAVNEAQTAARVNDATSAYEQLKRRREGQ